MPSVNRAVAPGLRRDKGAPIGSHSATALSRNGCCFGLAPIWYFPYMGDKSRTDLDLRRWHRICMSIRQRWAEQGAGWLCRFGQ